MSIGEDIALVAMQKEFKRLSRIADKAKAEADENMSIGSEMISIHQEFVEIVKSKEHGAHVIKKLESLQKRRDKAQKILDKDLLTLLNRQSEAECNRDSLGREIQMMEYRLRKRSRKAS